MAIDKRDGKLSKLVDVNLNFHMIAAVWHTL